LNMKPARVRALLFLDGPFGKFDTILNVVIFKLYITVESENAVRIVFCENVKVVPRLFLSLNDHCEILSKVL
jgi:hypothetical protein